MSTYDDLMAVLRPITRSTYMVNEKVAPTYERKWKLYVLHRDGVGRHYWGADTDAGMVDALQRAIRDAKQVAP